MFVSDPTSYGQPDCAKKLSTAKDEIIGVVPKTFFLIISFESI